MVRMHDVSCDPGQSMFLLGSFAELTRTGDTARCVVLV
jgi:hypothetical protein